MRKEQKKARISKQKQTSLPLDILKLAPRSLEFRKKQKLNLENTDNEIVTGQNLRGIAKQNRYFIALSTQANKKERMEISELVRGPWQPHDTHGQSPVQLE